MASKKRTVLTVLLVILGCASLIGNFVLIWLNTQRVPQCPDSEQPRSSPVIRHNQRRLVFADLSVEEYHQVRDYMIKIPGLDISYEITGLWSLKPRQKPTSLGPQQYYAQGKRFSIQNNHVSYLD